MGRRGSDGVVGSRSTAACASGMKSRYRPVLKVVHGVQSAPSEEIRYAASALHCAL